MINHFTDFIFVKWTITGLKIEGCQAGEDAAEVAAVVGLPGSAATHLHFREDHLCMIAMGKGEGDSHILRGDDETTMITGGIRKPLFCRQKQNSGQFREKLYMFKLCAAAGCKNDPGWEM